MPSMPHCIQTRTYISSFYAYDMIQIIHFQIHDRSVNENKSEKFIFALILHDFDSYMWKCLY